MTNEQNTYLPNENEDYMNEKQLLFFKKMLSEWKESIINTRNEIKKRVMQERLSAADEMDQMIMENEINSNIINIKRDENLINEIDEALDRIESGDYGYCEETGEQIGVQRLIVYPLAKLSLNAQEKFEKNNEVKKVISGNVINKVNIKKPY